jgi:Flp pilus assembly protein TadG
MRLNRTKRSGVSVIECAVVYPLVLLFSLGLVVGAFGVFRYQEVASLARRAARYASVHGTQYAKDTGNPAATPADIYNNAIVPYAVGLDTSKIVYSVTYSSADNQPRPYSTTIVNGDIVATGNTVTVTVQYQWIPEAFFGGVTLSSTSVMPMSY